MNPDLLPPESWLSQSSESKSDSSSELDFDPLVEDGIYMDDYDFLSKSNSYSNLNLNLDLDTKQKVNEEEVMNRAKTSNPLPMTHDHISCCKRKVEDLDDEFVINKDCWNKYFQQLRQSQESDSKDYLGTFSGITAFPRPNYLKFLTNVENMKDNAEQALKLYNEKFVCSCHTFHCLSTCPFSCFL
ncbi:hypothetical protein CQW23_28713 [Capsicum baccatum]|uniref:Uncharacterized protein n=1 Tax=Capsicum baccatum TaxID=33114 RepID=A0A2G2VHA9_CAPBA|nr:hypothetical protein CQW23_28713 [Capsicum baccatum]